MSAPAVRIYFPSPKGFLGTGETGKVTLAVELEDDVYVEDMLDDRSPSGNARVRAVKPEETDKLVNIRKGDSIGKLEYHEELRGDGGFRPTW
jgi:hypothetical protein